MKTNISCSIFLTAVVFLCAAPPAPAEDQPALAVQGDRTKAYVTYLASKEMEGRKSGTEGYRRAADWVAAKFAEWGLKPAGEQGTYFQEMAMRDFDWNTGVPRLLVEEREFFLDDGDFSLHRVSTAGTKVEAEVVFVGYGISAPDKGLDEYEGLDVKHKVVLAFKGSPTKAPERRSWYTRSSGSEEDGEKEDPWKEESKDQAKIKTAYDQGAAAMLLYDPDPEEDTGRGSYRYRRSSREEGFKAEREFLCFTIEERIFRAVMRRDPQETSRGMSRRIDSMRRAIKDKKPQSLHLGVPVALKGYNATLRHSKEAENNSARNVLAKIEGTDPALKDQYIVLGAHLDHLGVRNGYVYNGADDNASGSAVVMEVGRVLAEGGFQPKRTILCCCWAGEEQGLIGSYHFTKNPCDGVSMDRVVACFNMDMVGLGETLRASGGLNFPSIWDVIVRDQNPEIMEIIQPGTGGPGGSDHSGFIEKGIEAMMIISSGGDGHPDYHQPEDDAEKIDPEMLRKTGQFILQGVMNLANETETTLLIEDRETKYRALRVRISNYNPDLPDSRWKYVTIDAPDKASLHEKILGRALEIIRNGSGQQGSGGNTARVWGAAPSSSGDRASGPVSRSVTRGLADLRLFEGDLKLFEVASEIYGFGRVDIKGDDGFWIAEGRLTDKGKEAVKAMESNKIVLHLVSPEEALIEDLLSAATKPFVITGDYTVTESMADRIVDKNVLLGVDLDPKDVGSFITRLEELKNRVGKRELLAAFLTSTEGLEEAKRPLYLGLLEKGWSQREISGTRRRRAGILGGNFNLLTRD